MLHLTKSQLSALVASGQVHESFEHSHCGTFDITLMRRYAHANPLEIQRVRFPINDAVRQFILSTRDTEQARIEELSEASWRHDPIIVVLYADGKTLIVDGHHRLLRRLEEGVTDAIAYAFREDQIIRPQAGWGTLRGVEWGEKTLVNGELVPMKPVKG